MPDADAPTTTTLILLWLAVGLLGCLLVLVGAVWRKLGQLERRLGGGAGRQKTVEAEAGEAAGSQSGGAFETFLNEDPARRELPKREQFAAYRQWRKERGMNWSKP